MAKPFNDDLYDILVNKAVSYCKKYNHTSCTTNHLFLSMFGFLSMNKEKDPYKNIYNKLRETINGYGITGKSFEAAFLKNFPKGSETEEFETLRINADTEVQTIMASLKNRALKEKTQMGIEDLVLELFADTAYTIFDVFTEITGSANKTEEMYKEITKKFKKPVEIKSLEGLPELTNLNKYVSEHPVRCIDNEGNVKKIELGLAGRSIRNVVLTGPAGCGKTAYVYEFVRRIVSGECSDLYADKIVYEVNTGALVAGTRYRGDMEEKIVNILKEVKKNDNIILFIDELHSFLEAGAGSDGAQGAGNLLKPYLSRGEIQMIGCTTNEEYTKYVRKDKAFERRFHEVKINEPNEEATRAILEGILEEEEHYFNKEIEDGIVKYIISASQGYSLDQANPAKSINMLELACAHSRVFNAEGKKVTLDDLITSLKLKYNIYISEDKFKSTKSELFNVLLGQDDALNHVLRNLRIVDMGITDENRPKFSMLLSGPSGTGKTETARIIAKNYFGNENNLIKINMGEYSSEMDVSKLVGASQGYIGSDIEPELIKKVRERPNSIVLFDEIEKAHPSVQKILLNILDEGILVDNRGNEISFRNTIIIFTTNLGCTKDTGKARGSGFIKTKIGYETEEINKAIENFFSPEFLGRLDDIVYYNALPESIIRTLVDRYLKEYKEKTALSFDNFTEEEIQSIIEASDIETRGARGVRKSVRKEIVKKESALLDANTEAVDSETTIEKTEE